MNAPTPWPLALSEPTNPCRAKTSLSTPPVSFRVSLGVRVGKRVDLNRKDELARTFGYFCSGQSLPSQATSFLKDTTLVCTTIPIFAFARPSFEDILAPFWPRCLALANFLVEQYIFSIFWDSYTVAVAISHFDAAPVLINRSTTL